MTLRPTDRRQHRSAMGLMTVIRPKHANLAPPSCHAGATVL
jgi:hypothetical protein